MDGPKAQARNGSKLCPFPVLPQELPDEPLFKDNLDFIPQAARGEWKRNVCHGGRDFFNRQVWWHGGLSLWNICANPMLWNLESFELVPSCSILFPLKLRRLCGRGNHIYIYINHGKTTRALSGRCLSSTCSRSSMVKNPLRRSPRVASRVRSEGLDWAVGPNSARILRETLGTAQGAMFHAV